MRAGSSGLRIPSTLVCDWPKAVHVRAYCRIASGGLSMYANIAGHIPGKTEVIKPDF